MTAHSLFVSNVTADAFKKGKGIEKEFEAFLSTFSLELEEVLVPIPSEMLRFCFVSSRTSSLGSKKNNSPGEFDVSVIAKLQAFSLRVIEGRSKDLLLLIFLVARRPKNLLPRENDQIFLGLPPPPRPVLTGKLL